MLNGRKYLLSFIILLIITLLISGCNTFLFGPSGSIEVTTNPSGAKIFLDSKDIGKITPYTVKNVSAGNHIIEVTLSDMKYTEIAEVKAYQTTSIYIEFYSQITLDKINVLPSYTTITLSLGNTITISSVTAYYSDYSSVNILLINCTYSSNNACATVNSSGTITGISAGAAIITVSYTEGGITKTDTVLVYIRNTPADTPLIPPVEDDIVYRALLVGVGNYQNFPDAYGNIDLLSPPYDVDRMIDVFNHCKFGTDEIVFSTPVSLKDSYATKTAIINGIASVFSGADDNDISYFYFSGHGINYEGISYLCPTEMMYTSPFSVYISTNELESTLSAIPGRKVVILNSCHSGGFIGKGKGKITISKEELISFNDEIINVFSKAQSKEFLTTDQYQVLTSCHSSQNCLEIPDLINPENSYGLFTMALCQGCGYDSFTSPYPADNNEDNKVNLQEAYLYVESTLELFEQDVQVYPTNSTFTIVEY